MQIPSIMQIVGSVQAGHPINQSVLVEFLKTVDQPQLQAWEAELTEEQITMLRGAMRGAMEKHEADKDRVRAAYNEMTSGDPDGDEDDLVDDEEGLI